MYVHCEGLLCANNCVTLVMGGAIRAIRSLQKVIAHYDLVDCLTALLACANTPGIIIC